MQPVAPAAAADADAVSVTAADDDGVTRCPAVGTDRQENQATTAGGTVARDELHPPGIWGDLSTAAMTQVSQNALV